MIINDMEAQHQIKRLEVPYFQYSQIKILPLVTPDMTVLKGDELAEIDEVISKYGDWNADRLSEWSHGDLPWKATKEMGTVMAYDFAMYRNHLYSVTVGRDDGDD